MNPRPPILPCALLAMVACASPEPSAPLAPAEAYDAGIVALQANPRGGGPGGVARVGGWAA